MPQSQPNGRRESRARSRSPGKLPRLNSKEEDIAAGKQPGVDIVRVLTCLVCGEQIARSGIKEGEFELITNVQVSHVEHLVSFRF